MFGGESESAVVPVPPGSVEFEAKVDDHYESAHQDHAADEWGCVKMLAGFITAGGRFRSCLCNRNQTDCQLISLPSTKLISRLHQVFWFDQKSKTRKAGVEFAYHLYRVQNLSKQTQEFLKNQNFRTASAIQRNLLINGLIKKLKASINLLENILHWFVRYEDESKNTIVFLLNGSDSKVNMIVDWIWFF